MRSDSGYVFACAWIRPQSDAFHPGQKGVGSIRIAQEALHNVGRHSGATRACLSLRSSGNRVRMVVQDNGRGFRLSGGLSELANRGKLGLLGMHERARLLGGRLEVRTAPGKGTTIMVELPRGAIV